jgi:hypothetical protein
MAWNIIKLSLLGALVGTSILLPLRLWHQAQSKVGEQERLLREQAGQLVVLVAENQRLSQLAAESEKATLASAQHRELLSLRGEIGLLRQGLTEATNLTALNRQMAAALANPEETPGAASAPEAQTVLAYWPRAQLGFAGYSSPTAALKTVLWAIMEGEPNNLAAGVTPEARAELTHEQWLEHGSAADEIAKSARTIADSLQPAKGFYVVGQRASSDDLVMFDVFFEGEGRTRTFAMKRIGTEWKFNVMGRAGVPDRDVHLGNGAWP